MATGRIYPLLDRILDGQLADILRRWQAEDLTLVEMAHRIRTEHGVVVSYETVRRWLAELPPEREPAA